MKMEAMNTHAGGENQGDLGEKPYLSLAHSQGWLVGGGTEKAGRKKSRLCANLHLDGAPHFNRRAFSPEAHHLTYHSPTGMDAGLPFRLVVLT